jgi:hypothetical protein
LAAATLHDAAILARLIERNRASDTEQIGKAQGTCRAELMHDAIFLCGNSKHCIVRPGQNFDPSGN